MGLKICWRFQALLCSWAKELKNSLSCTKMGWSHRWSRSCWQMSYSIHWCSGSDLGVRGSVTCVDTSLHRVCMISVSTTLLFSVYVRVGHSAPLHRMAQKLRYLLSSTDSCQNLVESEQFPEFQRNQIWPRGLPNWSTDSSGISNRIQIPPEWFQELPGRNLPRMRRNRILAELLFVDKVQIERWFLLMLAMASTNNNTKQPDTAHNEHGMPQHSNNNAAMPRLTMWKHRIASSELKAMSKTNNVKIAICEIMSILQPYPLEPITLFFR